MKIINKRPDLKLLATKHYEHKQTIKAKLSNGFKYGLMMLSSAILWLAVFSAMFFSFKFLYNSTETNNNSLSHIYSEMAEVNQREIYLKDVEFNSDEQSQELFKLLKQYQEKQSKQLANKIKHDIDFNKAGFRVKNYDYSNKMSISNFTQIESVKFGKNKIPLMVVDYTTTDNGHDVLDNKATLFLPE